MIISSTNDYSRHYWGEVLYVVRLTMVKIPSLICLVFLVLSVYKYKRLNFLLRKKEEEDLMRE